MNEKIQFAGPAWIDQARLVLEDLVAEQGEDGKKFSVCEIFTGAPQELAESSIVAWHFYIDGRTVRVGTGEVDDTDVKLRADYVATLPNARLVYTPEVLAELAQRPAGDSNVEVEGDMSVMPPYLIELHNRMAVLTA